MGMVQPGPRKVRLGMTAYVFLLSFKFYVWENKKYVQPG